MWFQIVSFHEESDTKNIRISEIFANITNIWEYPGYMRNFQPYQHWCKLMTYIWEFLKYLFLLPRQDRIISLYQRGVFHEFPKFSNICTYFKHIRISSIYAWFPAVSTMLQTRDMYMTISHMFVHIRHWSTYNKTRSCLWLMYSICINVRLSETIVIQPWHIQNEFQMH